MTQSPSTAETLLPESVDSRALARSPGLNQFRLNPFRVLGVPATMDASKAVWRAEKLLTRVRAGLPAWDAPALPWLLGVDELEIQQAAQRIEEPLPRLCEQLLWFDFEGDPEGETLRRALVEGDRAALAKYQAIGSPPPGGSSASLLTGPAIAPGDEQALLTQRVNQANLRLALGFSSLYGLAPELLGASERDEGAARLSWVEDAAGGRKVVDPHRVGGMGGQAGPWGELLRDGLARWAALLNDAAFPRFLGWRISGLGDELVTAEDREPLAAALRTRLADLVVGEMKLRLMGGRVDLAGALARLAVESGLDPQVWTLAFRPLRSLFRAELAELDPLVDESKPAHLKDLSLYLRRLQTLSGAWKEIDPKQLLGLSALIDEAVLRAFERVRSLDFPLAESGEVSSVLEEAARVASAASVRERLHAAVARMVLRREELCHFCQKREQVFEYAAALTGRVETGRTQGFNSTTVHYRMRSIPILRCATCAQLHHYLALAGEWIWFAVVVAAVLFLFLFQPEGLGQYVAVMVAAAAVALPFRPILGKALTPTGELSYSSYGGSKAHMMLREENYGQLEYAFTLRAWAAASANLKRS